MSRTLSTTALRALYSQDTEIDFIELLKFSHEDLSEPIQVCNYYTNIVSNGDTYIGTAFNVSLPDDEVGVVPVIQVTVDNVDRLMIDAIRGISSYITVDYSIVLSSDYDVVEFGPITMQVNSVSYDSFSVTAQCSMEDILNKRFPPVRVEPSNFTGCF